MVYQVKDKDSSLWIPRGISVKEERIVYKYCAKQQVVSPVTFVTHF